VLLNLPVHSQAMTRMKPIFAFVIPLIMLASAQRDSDSDTDFIQQAAGTCPSNPTVLPAYVKSNLELGVNLYKKIVQSGYKGNIVFSPALISGALELLELGAEGATRDEIHDIHSPEISADQDLPAMRAAIESLQGSQARSQDQGRQFELYGANGVFIDEKFTIN